MNDIRQTLPTPTPEPQGPHGALTCLPRASSYCQRSSREGARERQWVHLWPPLVLLSPTADAVQTYPLNCKTAAVSTGLRLASLEPACPAQPARTSQASPARHHAPSPPASPRPPPALTLLEHAHPQALGEATGLAGLASPLGDLTLVGGRTAVLDAPCQGRGRAPVAASRGPEGA